MKNSANVTHPNAQPMKFCQSVTRYLVSRPEVPKFKIGDWFRLLDMAELGRVQQLASAVLNQERHAFEVHEIDDIVALVTVAATAESPERLTLDAKDLFELLSALLLVVGIERLCRKQWLIAKTRLSVLPDAEVVVEITPKGVAEGNWIDDPVAAAIFGLTSTRH